MINKKTIFTSVAIFIAVYLVLVIPMFGGAQAYADFYRKQGFYWFNHFGDQGFVVFEAHEDNGQDDTRVYQANKSMADAKGNMKDVSFNLSTRILGYLPVVLLISLFVATPIKLWKRFALAIGGFCMLHVFLMFFLYILILSKYMQTPSMNLYQDIGKTSKSIIDYLYSSINHGLGLNNFLVIIIWVSLVFFFERNVLSNFIAAKDK